MNGQGYSRMEMDVDCWACNPRACASKETPYVWSLPRALCAQHKASVTLQDGLSATALFNDQDDPVLSWILNPVFLSDGTGRKGWIDFAAGGFAVFEDRFNATTYFEERAFESTAALDFLYGLRLAMTRERPPVVSDGGIQDNFDLVLAAFAACQTTMPPDLNLRDRGPNEGLSDLLRVWNFQARLSRVRAGFQRHWPVSPEDLAVWRRLCIQEGQHANEPEKNDGLSFFPTLAELAARRFPGTIIPCAVGD